LHTHGGLPGIRDANALEAAIASPRNLWAHSNESDLFILSAHLLVAVAKCHGYIDGMKRTALSTAVMLLGANGIEVHLDDVKAEPDQQEDSAERRSRSGHGGQLTAAIRSR
jgi:death-on-curing protein